MRNYHLTPVAAIDSNLGLGNKGDLLVRLKEDLQHFKTLTRHQRVIYGKNTLLTFPQAAPLPERENIILTDSEIDYPESSAYSVKICHSLAELFAYLESVNTDLRNFVIGGASVYRQLLPYSDCLELTEIDHAFAQVDVYFPDFRRDFCLRTASEMHFDGKSGLNYRYCTYVRR